MLSTNRVPKALFQNPWRLFLRSRVPRHRGDCAVARRPCGRACGWLHGRPPASSMPTCGPSCSSACLPKCGARCCAYKAMPCGANCSAACLPKCGPRCCAYYARMERRERLERAFLRDPLYALPPECRAPPNQVKAFNLGLPRSGTTWFAALMRNLGLRALHCNSRVHCQGVESRRLVRPDGANASSPYLRKVLADFDAFSDLPFYWLPRPALSAVGRPLFFVTRREVHEWMQSFCGKIVPIMKGSECGGPGAAPSSLLEYAQALAGERSADGRARSPPRGRAAAAPTARGSSSTTSTTRACGAVCRRRDARLGAAERADRRRRRAARRRARPAAPRRRANWRPSTG